MTPWSRISRAWAEPAHLAILAVVSLVVAGGAVAAYLVLKRDSDQSCPPPCTLEVDQPPQARRAGEDRQLALLRLRRAAHALPADEARQAALRRLGLELPSRQAARVLADRRQGDALLPGQGRDALRAQRRPRQGRVEARRSAPSAPPHPPTRTESCSRSRCSALPGRSGRGAGPAGTRRQAPLALPAPGPQRDVADRPRDATSSSAASPATSTRSTARPARSTGTSRPPAPSRAGWRSTTASSTAATTPGRCSRYAPPTAFVWQSSTQGLSFGRGGPVYSTPAVAFGRVFLGSIDSRVYSFDADSGDLLWSHSTGDWVYAAPAVADTPRTDPTVYVGSKDQNFYALDAKTGEVRWQKDLGGVDPRRRQRARRGRLRRRRSAPTSAPSDSTSRPARRSSTPSSASTTR